MPAKSSHIHSSEGWLKSEIVVNVLLTCFPRLQSMLCVELHVCVTCIEQALGVRTHVPIRVTLSLSPGLRSLCVVSRLGGHHGHL